jgi:hypothetical protein
MIRPTDHARDDGDGFREGLNPSYDLFREKLLNQFNGSARRENHPKSCQSLLLKNILLFRNSKSPYMLSRLVPLRGVSRSSQNAGRDAVDAGSADNERLRRRTAKSCGSGSPTLESSSWMHHSRTTVAKKPGHRGDHEATVNHCAGNAGSFR